ncbi:NADPH oxidase 4-like isoform X1 [Schistocerca piceifrons]|uniref:NADPH oxidase 4-like isoform X1 n=2 Tax=Schistocerca piceifrons TaxID=274613 RepID=UPI001F5F87B3|nr:NADPH oxidase 4-like isoform X1 [Schistocerca piceifrons]
MARRRCRGRSWLRRASFWLLVFWLSASATIFWKTYSQYKNKPQHIYLRSILGRGLCLSRATAAVLNLACCLVLIPMCRSLSSALHSTFGYAALSFWLQKGKFIHITCAITILLAAAIHTAAHVANAVNFSRYYSHNFPEINWASYEGQAPLAMILTSVAGITGVAMVVLLCILAVMSVGYVRKRHYNAFWFTHHLFLPFLLLLLCHPLSGVLKELKNPEEHIPGCLINVTGNITEVQSSKHILCKSEAIFVPMESQGWLWIVLPLSIYSVDATYRVMRRNVRSVTVLQVTRLPGAAIRLQLQCSFTCQPGQYILLQCPVISSFEWHPFSITSVSNLHGCSSFSILIQAKGDWTGELCGRVLVPFSHCQQTTELCRWPSPEPVRFLVDGPFSSSLQSILHTPVAICIAGGSGVTPFASIFQYLLDCTALPHLPERLHFVWLLKNVEQLLWFASLLCSLHDRFWMNNQPDRLNIILHVTKNYSSACNTVEISQKYKVLLHRLQNGRPKWGSLFKQWKNMYRRPNVAVFASGPTSLTKEIKKHCYKCSKNGTSFRFMRESF